jgi:hypothetical protein
VAYSFFIRFYRNSSACLIVSFILKRSSLLKGFLGSTFFSPLFSTSALVSLPLLSPPPIFAPYIPLSFYYARPSKDPRLANTLIANLLQNYSSSFLLINYFGPSPSLLLTSKPMASNAKPSL